MDDKTLDIAQTPSRPAADPAPVGWRLLAFVYDAVPLLALLMIASAVLVAINGGRTVEHAPALAALEFAAFWAVCGAYFVASWRRGGQTLGMRPWRLKLVAADGRMASTRALVLRYVVASATPVVGWGWCLVDSRKRAVCDVVAGTVFVRVRGGEGRGWLSTDECLVSRSYNAIAAEAAPTEAAPTEAAPTGGGRASPS